MKKQSFCGKGLFQLDIVEFSACLCIYYCFFLISNITHRIMLFCAVSGGKVQVLFSLVTIESASERILKIG